MLEPGHPFGGLYFSVTKALKPIALDGVFFN
jgi:hypothetical protein